MDGQFLFRPTVVLGVVRPVVNVIFVIALCVVLNLHEKLGECSSVLGLGCEIPLQMWVRLDTNFQLELDDLDGRSCSAKVRSGNCQ